jgi:hypothetical protein
MGYPVGATIKRVRWILTKEKLYSYHFRYCSKIHAGMSAMIWENEIQRYLPFLINTENMHPTVDSGIGWVVAKVVVSSGAQVSGAQVDIVLALLLPRKLVQNMILDQVVLWWEDLDKAKYQQALQQLQDTGHFCRSNTSQKRWFMIEWMHLMLLNVPSSFQQAILV